MRSSRNFITSKIILLAVILYAAGCYYFTPSRIGQGLEPVVPYEPVDNWSDPNVKFGNPTGLGVTNTSELVVFHRAGRTWPVTGNMPSTPIEDDVVVFLDAASGKKIQSWGKGMFIMPHGLTIDHEDNVWLTDVALHQVFKFNKEGKLLMKLGEANVYGADSDHFDMPTDVAVDTDGSFYVSDGYGNSRILKFDANGRFLFQWGKEGKGKGEFRIPHSIDIAEGKVYVADRENRRVQVFDRTGKYLTMWQE